MSIYDEQYKQLAEPEDKDKYNELYTQFITRIDLKDSVIYLDNDITNASVTRLIIQCRYIISNRRDKDADINLMITGTGDSLYHGLGIVDYMKSLPVKINTIGRGVIQDAAAIVLTQGTGARMMSENSILKFSDQVFSNIVSTNINWPIQDKQSVFITSEQAKTLELIDEII